MIRYNALSELHTGGGQVLCGGTDPVRALIPADREEMQFQT